MDKKSIIDLWYCCKCDKQYNEKSNDIKSSNIEDYCRFLGYCEKDCWDKLPPEFQIFENHIARKKGDIVKRNHKWYLENVPNYKNAKKN